MREALRALEKKYRDISRHTRRVPAMLGLTPLRCHTAFAKQMADDLSALLSARQEVAPVAYMEPVTFNASSAADFAEALRKWPDDYDDWFPVYRESPAQTSEARDALPKDNDGKEQDAFEEWAKSEGFDMVQHPLHWLFLNERTNAARKGWRGALAYVNAAMRQEAGK